MRILSGGNVGIGTTNPSTKLDVKSTAILGNSAAIIGNNSGVTSIGSIGNVGVLGTGSDCGVAGQYDLNVYGEMGCGAGSSPVGVYGQSEASNRGYVGYNNMGTKYGIYGTSTNIGVFGDGDTIGGSFVNSDTSGDDIGVRGNAWGAGGTNHYGGQFLASGATNNIGALGNVSGSSVLPGNIGVVGTSNNIGVEGKGPNGGVYGQETDTSADGVIGFNGYGFYTDYQGYFDLGVVSGSGFTGLYNNLGNANTLCSSAANSGTIGRCAASSIRYKENVMPINLGLDAVLKLRPIEFSYKKEVVNTTRRFVGLIAEEVENVSPLLVEYELYQDENNITKSRVDNVKYSDLTAVLTKAIQEQQSEIEQLKSIVCADHPDADLCNKQ
jgi:hypothetical protein